MLCQREPALASCDTWEFRSPDCRLATFLPLRTSTGSEVAIQGAGLAHASPLALEALVGWSVVLFGRGTPSWHFKYYST